MNYLEHKKRELVKSITKITSKVTGLPENTITIIIREVPTEDVGVAGMLLCDRE